MREIEIKPRFKEKTDGHFFDINSNSTAEVAKVIKEEMKTRDLTKRVTNSDPVMTVKGIPEIEFSRYNVHAEAEWQATFNAFELAKKGSNLIFWISAEDGGEVYMDGRFNIYFKTITGNEITLTGKHMPLEIDRFKSWELGKRLIAFGGETIDKIDTVENLRIQPIGFNLENNEEWIDKCRQMIPEFEDFWKMFENGDDIRQEEETKKVVEEVKILSRGDNKIFQLEMARRGYEINNQGNHGIGYLGQQNNGVYNFKIGMIGEKFYTEPVLDRNGNLVCPVCGAKVSSSDTICPKCKIGLKDNYGD
jgi:rubrerythrin